MLLWGCRCCCCYYWFHKRPKDDEGWTKETAKNNYNVRTETFSVVPDIHSVVQQQQQQLRQNENKNR